MAEVRLTLQDPKLVRRQASPRPFLPSYTPSSIDEPGDEPLTNSSGAQSPARGRTLHRTPAQSRPVSRTPTRKPAEFNLHLLEWKSRLITHDFTHTPAEYDNSLFEPLPFVKQRLSLSEELYRAATFDDTIDITRFAGHRDTFAVSGSRQLPHRNPTLPLVCFAQIAACLDLDAYKALRFTCHSWSMAISYVRPINLSPFMLLPAEILKRIYIEISPADFNAARRTCRAWMITSLEESVMSMMVKRGGWSSAVLADKEIEAEQGLEYRAIAISDDWLLGKRIATECSLSPRWTGNGLGNPNNFSTVTAGLRLTSEIDFSLWGAGTSNLVNDRSSKSLRFAISNCSKFLLSFQSNRIYIYALRGTSGHGQAQPYGGYMRLWASIFCPTDVLAVSMDSSSQRYTVAALLHGSGGIIHDSSLTDSSNPQLSLNYAGCRSLPNDSGPGLTLTLRYSSEFSGRNPSIYPYTTSSTISSDANDHLQASAAAESRSGKSQGLLRSSTVWSIGGGSQQPLNDLVSSTYATSIPITGFSPQSVSEFYCQMLLGDGHHMIFMLPESRELHVGQEYYTSSNSRKLTNDFVFVGPRDEHGRIIQPRLFAAAAESRWGLRVAVIYSNQLWLFVVPPDMLIENGLRGKKADISTATGDDITVPIQVLGTKVAAIVGLANLALDASAGDLTLWAFSQDAKAYVFQLAGSGSKAVTQRAVVSDGAIVLTRDEDGDTIMTDAPHLPEDSNLHSDGTTSLSYHGSSLLVPCFPSCFHTYCNDLLKAAYGTLMTNADGSPPSGSVESHATSIHHGLPFSLTPCPLACGHRYCNLLAHVGNNAVMTRTTNFLPTSPPESIEHSFPPSVTSVAVDEGYASGDDEESNLPSSHHGTHFPPVWSR